MDGIDLSKILIYVIGFIWIVIASTQVSKYFQKIRFPLITGFLLSGIFVGPFVLDLIPQESVDKLGFIYDFSLAFIAFAAGAELYLKELRGSMKSIAWNTVGQLVVTFISGSVALYYLSGMIPFMDGMNSDARMAVSVLAALVFIASSPSSAIAIITELRAKGHFTKTAISVTVVKDVLIIVLFTISFSLADMFFKGTSFKVNQIFVLFLNLALSLGIGYLLSKMLEVILSLNLKPLLKASLVLLSGYSIYILSYSMQESSHLYFLFEIKIEPLLTCLTASFLVINYSRYRADMQKILFETGPMIYAAFFTLTGAMLSIDILLEVWAIALLIFILRLIVLVIGAWSGSTLAGDPKLHRRIGWMSYITQAGVALAFITEISRAYVPWGIEFATIFIAVIVLNQLVGPPLFKLAINWVGESHLKAKFPGTIEPHNVIIFGMEHQSLSLARELIKHGWHVRIASFRRKEDLAEIRDVEILFIRDFSLKTLERIHIREFETIVLMLHDSENVALAEMLYEYVGTKEVIVRLTDRRFINRFQELGVLVVDPTTAIINLLDHFVRSPQATSLLLGMEPDKDTLDIEISDKELHGVALRDIRLPSDVLILSVQRKGRMLISHGYTRLRIGDIVTVVGSVESLENVRLRFEE